MPPKSLLKLFALAAIWGGSFLFMRISAPVLGPVLLIQLRVALAAAFLFVLALAWNKRLNIRADWKHFVILGLFNTAVPFVLFAWSAQVLPASLLSVLNATTPIWGALIGAVWTRTGLSLKTMIGLALGIIGVGVLMGFDGPHLGIRTLLAIGASLVAALCYAIAALYSRMARSVDAFSNAHGSMWAAALLMAPISPFFPTLHATTTPVALSVLMLGIVCSGIAYVLYFKLIDEVGAASATTVSFLIPIFGVLWDSLLLHEPVTWLTALGAGFIILGTGLITGFSPQRLFRRQKLRG